MDRVLSAKEAAQIRHSIFANMRKTRGNKYDTIIKGMQLFPYVMLLQEAGNLTKARLKGELLISYYALMRSIDDIVDGDAPLPPHLKSATEYVNGRISFVSGQSKPSDQNDYLLAYCNTIAGKLGFSIKGETCAILRSMFFDAARVEAAKQTETGKIFPRGELEYHFHQLDIEGTIMGVLKLFDEDPEKTPLLIPAGIYERIKLTLKDLPADLRAGLVNIPSEDMVGYGIKPSDIANAARLPSSLELLLSSPSPVPAGIREWARAEAIRGLDLIAKQKQIMATNDFRILGKLALRLFYTRPTEHYFNRLLRAYSESR